jgi:hypothetical protein
MGEASRKSVREKKCIDFLVRKAEGKKHLEDLGV